MLQGEPSAQRVRSLVIDRAPVISSVNLGEVLYSLIRTVGQELAVSRVDGVRQVLRVEDPDWRLVEAAASVKAPGGLSYADAFCVATALRHGVPLATGDPEILALGDRVEVIDLRQGS